MAKRKKDNSASVSSSNGQASPKKIKIQPEIEISEQDGSLLELESLLSPPEVELQDVLEEAEHTSWPTEDLKVLLHRTHNAIGSNGKFKYTKTLEKIDWEQVKFESYTAEECQTCLTQLIAKVRKYRTLEELIKDSAEKLDSPPSWRTVRQMHPDAPKQPLSPFLEYFNVHLDEYRAKHGRVALTELSKLASQDYAKLPEKVRAKDKLEYAAKFRKYRDELLVFKARHPELFAAPSSRSARAKDAVPKPRKAFTLYYEAKSKNYESETKRDLMEAMRAKWTKLKDKKKIKWIRRAEKDLDRYNAEIEEYAKLHPGYEAKSITSILSKEEEKLKYKYEGRPEKPPNNGYALYCKIMLSDIEDVPMHEKLVIIAKKWNEMKPDEKEHYAKQAEKDMAQYQLDFQAYLQQLPEDKRELQLKKAKLKDKSKPSEEEQQRSLEYSATMAFQFEEMPKLQAKHSNKSKAEIMAMVQDRWDSLEEGEKTKYMEMAKKFQKFMPDKKSRGRRSRAPRDEVEVEFEELTGLKKPITNKFSYFTKQYFATYHSTEMDAKDRMVELSKAWKALTEEEQNEYGAQAKKELEEYLEKLEQFKKNSTLPDEVKREKKSPHSKKKKSI